MDPLIQILQSVVGPQGVLYEPEELLVYECDGLPQHKHRPRAVVFPESTEATAEVMRALARFNVPFTPRGAGTGLSGGALALNSGVVVELARMRRILNIDADNRTALVQTGVVNLHVSRAVAHFGMHYIPDPSSQPTCTIGGNIAENAGGIHCLKYGTTTDHVLGARVVLSTGDIVDLHSGETGENGYDLLGVFVGSEGTFGIATEATLRLTPLPPAVRTLLAEFPTVDAASHAVSAIIAAGVMPAALEMMDREIIRAIEASIFAAGLPTDIGAALLIELDGVEVGIDEEAERVRSICISHAARNCRLARDEQERKKLWAARKGAFGAIGRIAPDSMIQDAVVPRSKLPQIMEESYRIAAKYKLVLANVFHAGDGNLHPLICFDSRSPEQVLRVKEAGRELMETCVRAGGSITGEHGVGLDKRDYLPLIFSADDMQTMLAVRRAFDPLGLLNPGKVIPTLRGCGEGRAVASVKANGDDPQRQPEAFITTLAENYNRLPASTLPRFSRRAFDPDFAQRSLAAIVGDANVRNSSNENTITVLPATATETGALMRLASQSGWTVVPSGAGTWLRRNVDNVQVIVNTTRINRIIDHEPADLIATAEPGMTLTNFNAALSLQGQWLPLDPPNDGNATIGGVVATGQAGAQSFGYGPPRRHVIGLRVVLPDGRQIRTGGHVVKNVAGYDLSKLFTGSFGTLGIITELTFKLRPLPPATATVVIEGPLSSLINASRLIFGNVGVPSLFPVAAELVSPRLAPACGLANTSHHVLLVRFAGGNHSVIHEATTLINAVDDMPEISSTNVVNTDDQIWRAVAALPSKCCEDVIVRTTLKPSELPHFLTEVQTEVEWQASVCTGIARLFVNTASEENTPLGIVEKLSRAAVRSGGRLTVENSTAGISHHSLTPADSPLVKLAQRIKRELDPHNTLPAVDCSIMFEVR